MFRHLKGHHQAKILVTKYRRDKYSLFKLSAIPVLQPFSTCCSSSWLNIKQCSQCTYNVTMRRVLATIVAVGKQRLIHNPSCMFVAFGIQHAIRVRHISDCGLPCSAVLFHIFSKDMIFLKKNFFGKRNVCFDFL